jgi:hypothetical protein
MARNMMARPGPKSTTQDGRNDAARTKRLGHGTPAHRPLRSAHCLTGTPGTARYGTALGLARGTYATTRAAGISRLTRSGRPDDAALGLARRTCAREHLPTGKRYGPAWPGACACERAGTGARASELAQRTSTRFITRNRRRAATLDPAARHCMGRHGAPPRGGS